ncbi:MAG: tyrosine recombinase XerS [Anaerobacillus sp.]
MATSRQQLNHQRKYEALLPVLPEYVRDYILALEENERSASTILNYVIDIKSFLEWLQIQGIADEGPIKDISHEVLATLPLDAARAYFNQVSNEEIQISRFETKKRERASVNRKKSALRSLFKYLTTQTEQANGEPLFHRNVMQKIAVIKPKETLNERSRKLADTIFQEDDDVAFLHYLQQEYERSLSDRQRSYFLRDKERDFAILSLFLGSGIRLNELADIRLRDLHVQNSSISVIRKGNKMDSVYVIPEVFKDIANYLAVRKERYGGTDAEHEYLFLSKYKKQATPLSVRTIQDLVRKYTKSYRKEMSPHKLRHTYATNLMGESKDLSLVMEQLGHSSTSTSVLYVHSTQEKAKRAAEALGARRNQARSDKEEI